MRRGWLWAGLIGALLVRTPVAAADPSPDAVIQKDLVQVEVHSDGSTITDEDDVVKVLTPAGIERFGRIERYYDSATTTVSVTDADVVWADGGEHPVPRDLIKDVVPSDARDQALYRNVHLLTVEFPRVAPGMTVHFHVRTNVRVSLVPGQAWATSFFQDESPIGDSVFVVSFPEGLPMHWQGTGLMAAHPPEVQRTAGHIRWTWHATDLPAVPDEGGSPSVSARSARIMVSTFANWDQVATALGRLWDKASDPTGVDLSRYRAGTSLADLAQQVLSQTRELSVNLPADEWAPSPLAQVVQSPRLSRMDRCVLLLGLARAAGLPLSAGLGDPQDASLVDRSFPTPQGLSRAVVVSGEQVFEPAGDASSVNLPPPALLGQPLLLVPSGRSPSGAPAPEWRTVPMTTPADNRQMVRLEARVDNDGALSELVIVRQSGAINTFWRDLLADSGKDEQAEVMTGLAQLIVRDAVVSSWFLPHWPPLQDVIEAQLAFDVEAPAHGGRRAPVRLPLLPDRRLASYLPAGEPQPRQTPLVLGFPSVDSQFLHLVLPEATRLAALPSSLRQENEVGSYELTVTSRGRDVWAISRLTIGKATVPPEQYGAFVTLVRTALKAEKTLLTLAPASAVKK